MSELLTAARDLCQSTPNLHPGYMHSPVRRIPPQAERRLEAQNRVEQFRELFSSNQVASLPLYVLETTTRRTGDPHRPVVDIQSQYLHLGDGWLVQPYNNRHAGPTQLGIFISEEGLVRNCLNPATIDQSRAGDIRAATHVMTSYSIKRPELYPDQPSFVGARDPEAAILELAGGTGLQILARAILNHGVSFDYNEPQIAHQPQAVTV